MEVQVGSPNIGIAWPKQDYAVYRLSDADIVADEDQAVLIALRDSMTACAVGIGDIVTKTVIANASKGYQVTSDRIFRAIARFCGRSARTVRYYFETASFFGPETREEFGILSFSHFVFARSCGDKWREVLEYAAINPGATVGELIVLFQDEAPGDTEANNEMRERSQIYTGEAEDLGEADAEEMCERSQDYIRQHEAYGMIVELGEVKESLTALARIVGGVADRELQHRAERAIKELDRVLGELVRIAERKMTVETG